MWAVVVTAASRVRSSALFTAPAVPSPGPAAGHAPSVVTCFGVDWWPIGPDSPIIPTLCFGPPVLPMALYLPGNTAPLGRVTRAAAHALRWS